MTVIECVERVAVTEFVRRVTVTVCSESDSY